MKNEYLNHVNKILNEQFLYGQKEMKELTLSSTEYKTFTSALVQLVNVIIQREDLYKEFKKIIGNQRLQEELLLNFIINASQIAKDTKDQKK